MPTEKQRRRRAKSRRHEWEYVYVDEEGREVEVDPEQLEGDERRREPRAERKREASPRGARPARQIEPPSWRRALRRGALFAPIMFLTVFLLSGELSTAQKLTQTLLLLFIFVPFSYLLDSMVWRAYRRKLARSGQGDGGKPAGKRS